jgi:hypothetical protein
MLPVTPLCLQFAMHSIREMCGTADVRWATEHFRAFFEEFGAVDGNVDVDACMVQPDGTIDDISCDCLVAGARSNGAGPDA